MPAADSDDLCRRGTHREHRGSATLPERRVCLK